MGRTSATVQKEVTKGLATVDPSQLRRGSSSSLVLYTAWEHSASPSPFHLTQKI